MGKYMQWLKSKFAETPVPYRFYSASLALFALGVLLSRVWDKAAIDIANTISSALIIGGFLMWCLPAARWMRDVWERPFGKTPIVLLHVLVLLVATSLSRFVVSDALGLPPQSFDLTVGFLALLFYLPAWMAVAAVIFVIFGFLLFVAVLIVMFVVGSVQILAPLLKVVGFNYSPTRNSAMALFHSAGAIATGLVLLTSYSFLTEAYQPWILSAIRLVAVKADFHSAPNYPGVNPGERVHPLENGYIAYARVQDDKSLVIGVRSQDTNRYDQSLPNPIPSVKEMKLPFFEIHRLPEERSSSN
ncbi:hypothetical protein QN386_01385 [Pseudomonas sp. CCI3.2]|uniref:hypothetical protein n=1 Tax=unclassified Pseudomonas TaxID=196821 RepID=UPI002AC9D3CD|nr:MULTISPECIES: hypothetical protein [unclassified Pseudomonas]MEB0080322.1 hypothetical protein [Pseudomonas sp. MH10out]MEB0091612.1 hypothetical protein [Pseudomonas sp. CCI4.2]MEB0099985.1 hypothetical protein [Pseudomonas sp. CCI3.2]MEB0129847.1 hypothetical protein [Pseudomonas sp. CCI2.4]MEB0157788.1 hypothetical protein [Pseudomonas sp. AH2 (2023)]